MTPDDEREEVINELEYIPIKEVESDEVKKVARKANKAIRALNDHSKIVSQQHSSNYTGDRNKRPVNTAKNND